jgi:hypothetical protein
MWQVDSPGLIRKPGDQIVEDHIIPAGVRYLRHHDRQERRGDWKAYWLMRPGTDLAS